MFLLQSVQHASKRKGSKDDFVINAVIPPSTGDPGHDDVVHEGWVKRHPGEHFDAKDLQMTPHPPYLGTRT